MSSSPAPERQVKRNRKVVYACKSHVVWCPEYRRQVLVSGVEEQLRQILHGTATELEAEVIELAVMPDHGHLRVDVDPQVGLHRLARHLKGRSSRLLRQEFAWRRSRLPTLWTHSYLVSPVGGAPLAIIQQDIENRKSV